MNEQQKPLPITILKDRFINGNRYHLLKYNEYLTPISRSLLRKSAELQTYM